jgi:hypothetical protein
MKGNPRQDEGKLNGSRSTARPGGFWIIDIICKVKKYARRDVPFANCW